MSTLNVNEINGVLGIKTVTFSQDESVINGNLNFGSEATTSVISIKLDQVENTSGINTSTSDEIYNGRIAAWAHFNGTTGTQGNNDVTIDDSYNVSSVTDNNVGQHIVNFTSALPTVDYAAVANAGSNPCTVSVRNFNTTSVRVDVFTSAGAALDRSTVCVLITNP